MSGKIIKDEFEPLYCLAVSSKRYCLFNIDGSPIEDTIGPQRTIVIRKASAHGLGDVMLPAGYKPQFEHYAAPIEIKKDDNSNVMLDDDGNVMYVFDEETGKPIRLHSKLVAGSAAPLFLDMWYAAITELDEKGSLDSVDDIICAWPSMNVPQHSQTSLSTRDAWLNYQALPNRRAFQFMETLPAPMEDVAKLYGEQPVYVGERPPTKGELGNTHDSILMSEFQDAQKASLYTAFSRPFVFDLGELYGRDTNELIKPYLNAGLRLTTVADRVRGYFAHGEAKSEGEGRCRFEADCRAAKRGEAASCREAACRGKTGLLARKCVAGLSKVWIGKESHPLADVADLPDDETLEHYKAEAEIISGGLNHDLIVQAGISEVAKAARVDEITLVDAVIGQKAS